MHSALAERDDIALKLTTTSDDLGTHRRHALYLQGELARAYTQRAALQHQLNIQRDIVLNLQQAVSSESLELRRRNSSCNPNDIKDRDLCIARVGSGSLDSKNDERDVDCEVDNDVYLLKFQLEHYQKIFRTLASFEYFYAWLRAPLSLDSICIRSTSVVTKSALPLSSP